KAYINRPHQSHRLGAPSGGLPCRAVEKAPAIEGRGKLAERIEVEFGPFRPAASRRAECFLVALPPVPGSSAPKICSFGPGATSAAAYPAANSFLQPFLGRLPGAPNSRWQWWSVALPCRRTCARSRPDGGGSAGGCRRRSWLWLVEVGIIHVP